MRLKDMSFIDLLAEIRRRLYTNTTFQTPTTDYQAANKKYVDDGDTSPLVYEGYVLTYNGEVLTRR